MSRKADPYEHLLNIVKSLDENQVNALMRRVHLVLQTEKPSNLTLKDHPNTMSSSVTFALLLHFKKVIIDCIIQHRPLDKLQNIVSFFHPMECIYMIIHSTFVLASPETDGIESLFGSNVLQAYEVYKYIVMWLAWKVEDPIHNDERYFQTYFNDYTKDERKRVLRSFAPDILEYIARQPTDILPVVVSSFADLVPLLDDAQLGTFWTFVSSFGHDADSNHMQQFFAHVSKKQMRELLSYPLTPLKRKDPALQSLVEAAHSRLAVMTGSADCTALLGEFKDILLRNVITSASSIANASDVTAILSQPSPLMELLDHAADRGAVLISLIQSRLLDAEERRACLRTCIMRWALHDVKREEGLQALTEVERLQPTIANGSALFAVHDDATDTDVPDAQLCFIDSVELWLTTYLVGGWGEAGTSVKTFWSALKETIAGMPESSGGSLSHKHRKSGPSSRPMEGLVA
ncbi:hypothetical protein HK104_004725 [Borealophlyctis nickersoniae]|nr:hypothetical protein HK104_004725 [Borealophlyctis nickersoniae]